ncbi:hypothetical protein C2G38_2075631 [Gigaspora rosea]|uniref:Uncharacterized protein n=1 Tax=Gigaspora rosea TaxID=44941 RepID=A0A397VN37_9GLOM|nr:hypothetical protein C2G38_2075631 [Gigaspora rosea]
MNKQVPINILNAENISLTTTNEIPHVYNQEIEEEILKYIGKAGYRRITDILLFIIPGLVKQNILNTDNPILHVRLSGGMTNIFIIISELHSLVVNGLEDSSGIK